MGESGSAPVENWAFCSGHTSRVAAVPPSDSVLLSGWSTRAGQRLGLALWAYLQICSWPLYGSTQGNHEQQERVAGPACAGGNSLCELGLEE